MRIENTRFTCLAKSCAKPLSNILCAGHGVTLARYIDLYLNILLGKGAGTGWAMEAEISAAAQCIQNEKPIVFDVGANVGEWTEQVSERFPDGTFFLFEPQPGCQDQIIKRNMANVTIIPKVVSANSGQSVQLYTSDTMSGLASLHQRRDSYFQRDTFRPLDVATVTIDDVVRENSLDSVDFMKMDIEGHEFEALKGAANSLKNGTIKAIQFEFGSGNINSRTFFHDFWDLLTPLGFQIYRILPSSKMLHIAEYYEDLEYFRGVSNYIARYAH